ncbi:MAG: WD40/YVTN/BNR-like repeat-containing protein [Vicinamibacteria bacterium]
MRHRTLVSIAIAACAFFGPGLALAAPPGDDGLLADFVWRSIGPGSAAGRIVDVESLDADPRFILVASASGGVWKSVNAGTTFTPIFDRYATGSIGDVAVSRRDPQVIWVGTGEANNRNDVGWGDGVYKSTDGGATFTNVGLGDTYQIARIVLHPTDPQTAYVAAVGDLWGARGERGLFKTEDGGGTWRKLQAGLPAGNRAGATDLVIDPGNPDTLYVAFYQRLRRAYRFDSGGPDSGIFKSTDAGKTWRRLSNGLPAGDLGRIGLDISRKNPSVLMAIVEHGFIPKQDDPAYADMSRLGTGIYRSVDGGESWTYMNRHNVRPFFFSQVRINPSDDQQVYVLDVNLWQSSDGGRTLEKGARGFGYDFHAMWLDPNQHDRYYLGQDKGFFETQDHGRTFRFFDNLPVTQYYAIGVDMRDPYVIYGGTQDNGSWGVPSFTRDAFGIRNDDTWKLHWGDGMHAASDPDDWRRVYTEAENGSFRRYDPLSRTEAFGRPGALNVTNYEQLTGRKRPESAAPATDLAAFYAQMRADRSFRFNWQTPFIVSPHAGRTLYLGANHVFRSVDGGATWVGISPDLSNDDPETTRPDTGGLTPDSTGAETHATVVSLSESPLVPGLLWAGTDDGNVWVTRNGGGQWSRVNDTIPGVPAKLWVSDVEASAHAPGTAYVCFDGHRSDDFGAWVFKTTDYGKTWADIGKALPPNQTVHVLVADPRNPSLVFVGSEFGVFVSLDGGASWKPLMNGMPTVAVHDLVIHPRDNDLIAGTHGRGLYVMDDITPLQQLAPAATAPAVHLFEQRTATWWVDQSRGGQFGDDTWAGANPPSVRPPGAAMDRAKIVNTPLITWRLASASESPATLQIRTADGSHTRTLTVPAKAGITRYAWDGRFDPPAGHTPPPPPPGESAFLAAFRSPPGALAGPGLFSLVLTTAAGRAEGVLRIREDPLVSGETP